MGQGDILRVLLDNLSDCHVFVKDRRSRFVATNAFHLKSLGARFLENVIGKTDFDFFPKEMAERYFADEQNVMRSGKAIRNREEPCLDHKGQPMWLLTTKVPLEDSSGKVTGLVGISLDVTELKKTTNALAGERNLLRTLIDALPSRVYVKDLDGRFTVVNKALAGRLGLAAPADMIGKTDFELGARDWAQGIRDEDMAVMKGEIPSVRRIERHGTAAVPDAVLEIVKFPFRDRDGKVLGLVGVNTEVTELWTRESALREAQERLEEERNLLRMLIDNIPHDIYVKDTQGRFLVANAYVAATMKAGSPDDLIGRTDFDFYPGEVASGFRSDEDAILATGRPLIGKTEPKTAGNGEKQWIITSKLPLRDRDGKIVGIVGVGIDDTKRKVEEEKRHRLEEDLRHSEKLKAIGQLAGGIAHDFNNQLTAIMGSADMIRAWRDGKELAQHADMILTASRRAADLTGKLLAFARKGHYQSAPVDMHKIIAEVVALLDRSIDKRIKIRTEFGAGKSTVKGDPTQLQNALLNIAINARDAMKGEGEITFTTETVTLDDAYCRHNPHEIEPGQYILISVADTGTGMDEETRRHIFEPFFTTKPEGAGSGMGLAAVYGTVRNHEGTISFESELGLGTRFNLWFPVMAEHGVAEEEERDDVPIKGSAHILVVDDEDVVRETIKAVLEKLGYRVSLCVNGREALGLYEKGWRGIDLVIFDMVMPEMGGLDSFLAMRAINPAIRALLSSGYSMGGDARKILDVGVKGFVQKPFHVAALSRAIADALK